MVGVKIFLEVIFCDYLMQLKNCSLSIFQANIITFSSNKGRAKGEGYGLGLRLEIVIS